MNDRIGIAKACAAEGLGTALLLAGVVGSGIMGEKLSGGPALTLLANALATAALLPVLIQIFSPLSGAHFNPLVTLAEALEGRLSASRIPGYVSAQIAGAVAGTFAAHFMFGQPVLQFSEHARIGAAQWFSEAVAAFGLLLLILRRFHLPPGQLPWLVGAYIGSAYWFTASTSFANPAATLARSLTGSFAGIRPSDVPVFAAAQCAGAAAALAIHRLFGRNPTHRPE